MAKYLYIKQNVINYSNTIGFIENVLEYKTYHLANLKMNIKQAEELNHICETIMDSGKAKDYDESYDIYKNEITLFWGIVEDFREKIIL